MRGRDRGDRARLGRHRPVQPGDPARRGERLPGQAGHRARGARGGGSRGQPRRKGRRAGLAGRVRGHRRERRDDARRRHRPARGRARAVRLGPRSEPVVPRPLVPARRRARRRPRRAPQQRRAGVAAPGNGGRNARGALGPDRGLRLPVERGPATARAGVGGVRAARGTATPVAPRDRRRDGRIRRPARRCSPWSMRGSS